MKKYAAVFNFVDQLNQMIFLLARNEKEAINTIYHAAYRSCSWPKERVKIPCFWCEDESFYNLMDRRVQKKRQKKYSVPYEVVERNIEAIEKKMGRIIDHSIIDPRNRAEDLIRIQQKMNLIDSNQ